ncbi:MAG: formate dehydrogenase accessory protein FdhE [Paracoccus sp. (in: a-proteobacteria)]|nr:formate dehydrogenase accessory protein FdhE [Paracoccus sp. (in: a-proteobacteria)]
MSVKPDPSVISPIATPEFALLPDPARDFADRATRLRHLAHQARLGPYLNFLADLSDLQAALARELPPPVAPDAAAVARSRSYRMPPVDRAALIAGDDMAQVLDALLGRAGAITMPDPARAALDALRAAPAEDLRALIAEIATDHIPDGYAAPALFLAAAFQVAAARAASVLDAGELVAIRSGVCPACGGRPSVSVVVSTIRLDGLRYACCAGCATRWNEVRVKCLCCGSTKGIGYRALETGDVGAQASDRAGPAVQAEVCDECKSWVKILYKTRDAGVEPVADDIASLGLDMLMRDSEWSRGGFNPFLSGY